MTSLPDPLSRRDRQRQTREALCFAARAVFTRDGYHGARLDVIAREAGFSKGAVYSNFSGKAALFLAVVDLNLETALAEGGWDVFERAASSETVGEATTEAMRGFALATLEFIAVAARDEHLSAEMARRMQVLTDGYTAIAQEHLAPEEHFSGEELGALLSALDQGAALLTLAGGAEIDQRTLQAGMQRLLDPTGTRAEVGDLGARPGASALHHEVIQRRVAQALRGQS
ncbi:TetR/AcrR family transcriptional regulator [Bogoriella caseilytica]|uniref:TetR family transcriptional regulator n=1 Tax=Bogoriella caseilytica TaxID=56055 RepID=A0A3N2BA92_9MICO|nr:TetR/AcrR family transcriptional regulator [Bogoriella caseilytica]ROR72176.1 TetR family transcriptional regulator [Bogoriella caseilytica]